VSEEHAQLARRLYAALAVGDRAELEALLDPGFVGTLADGMPAGAGTHTGADAMRKAGWGAIARAFTARAEPDRFLAVGDDRLLVTGRYTGTGRETGGPLDAAFAHLLTIAGGRVTALEQYTDTARWRDAGAPAERVRLRVADGVAEVRLVRPEAGNAIDVGFTRELLAVTDRLAGDPGVRAVLLVGDGGSLTVGGDLALFGGTPHAELPGVLRGMIDDYHRAIERLAGLDAPLVVAVHGAAAGGGLGLVCLADIALAAEDAVFALGYARLGLTADGGNSWYLPRLVGLRRAQEMFLLNRRLTAAEALDWGLLTRVLPAADLDAEARAVAAQLAAGPTAALGGMRRLLRRSLETPLREQLADELDEIVAAAAHPDAAEGIAAFTQRRTPNFAGGEQ
jgi:2-(1,2-epoxy-1,2-dihydrophenyl)acetyl-CoA isomerase